MSDLFKPRHPLLVFVWSFGLLILLNIPQYFGMVLGALMGEVTLGDVLRGTGSNPGTILGHGIGVALVGIPCAVLAVRFLWRRSPEWMRFRFSGTHAVVGLLAGIVLTMIVVGITSVVGEVRIVGGPSRLPTGDLIRAMAGYLLFMSFIGVVEEAVFRGMVVREWAVRWGWLVASLAGGLFFGLLHLEWDLSQMEVIPTLQVLVAAISVTLLFVALYVRSGSLWLSIGFHAGWNFSLIALFGVTMSGHDSEFSLYQMSISGSWLVTGGHFGIEASAVAITAYLVTALAVTTLFRSGKPLLASRPPDQVDALIEIQSSNAIPE